MFDGYMKKELTYSFYNYLLYPYAAMSDYCPNSQQGT